MIQSKSNVFGVEWISMDSHDLLHQWRGCRPQEGKNSFLETSNVVVHYVHGLGPDERLFHFYFQRAKTLE